MSSPAPEELSFLSLINSYRQQHNLEPLHLSLKLSEIARWMNNDMITHRYVEHTDSLNRNPSQRMKALGYNYNTYTGENLAAGVNTAQEALEGWLNACDPDVNNQCTFDHRKNILNPNFKVIGISRLTDPSSPYKWFWTTDFGGYIDETYFLPSSTTPTTILQSSSPSSQSSMLPIVISIIVVILIIILILLAIKYFFRR